MVNYSTVKVIRLLNSVVYMCGVNGNPTLVEKDSTNTTREIYWDAEAPC